MTSAIRLLFRREQRWLVLIVLLALVRRLAWSFYADADPRYVWRFDMSIYDYQTEQLANGNGYIDYQGNPTAHWPPGYPMTLAPLYYLFENNTRSPAMLNVVLGSATVVLLYLLGARVFDRRGGLTGGPPAHPLPTPALLFPPTPA